MIEADLQNDRQKRFNSYLQFSMSDSFISYVTVEDQRLYFPKYDKNVTIADLNQQYSMIHQGKQLSLSSELFKIDPTTPLSQITSTPQKIQILEKVLISCKQNQDPLKQIKKPDEKKLAEELVSFVKKHNQKVQNAKQFQNHDCVIKVKNRPQSAAQFNYFAKKTTTMNEIAQFINKQAGKKVQLLSVQLGNGVTYNRNGLMSKPFSELRMNSKLLIFNYPQILTLKQITKFKIKLTNSPYIHQAIYLNVKKVDTIQTLLNSVKKISDFQDDPLQIHDSQGNLIEQGKWNNSMSNLVFRKFQFQFLYPTFISYECNLLISNFAGKTYQLKYIVHKNTTFNHMVRYIRQNIHCDNANFKITDLKGNNYGSQLRDKTLFNLKIQEQFFRFVYIQPTCLIRANTRLIVRYTKEDEQLQQITVQELIQSGKIKQVQIMTYDEEKHEMDFGRVSCFKKETGYCRLMSLTLAADTGIVSLECSADSTFKTQNFIWKPVRMLKKGEKIMMVRSDLETVHYAQILDLKQKAIQEKQQLFTLQVLPQHNFLANGVILHNDESYTFQVHFYQKNKPPRQQSLKCYLNEKLSEVPSFRGKMLTMGGLPLKNNLTFGDYQIYNFGTIFAFDQSYNQNSKEFIISAWREQSYKQQQVDPLLRDKWSSDYWGLRQSKIVQIKKDVQNMKSAQNPQQLLICPKMHLKKLNYVYNIVPQHKPYQQNIMKNYFRSMVMTQNYFKSTFQELMKKPDNFLKSEADLLPVYMYTTDILFWQLNSFLRMPHHPKSTPQQIQQIKQWYVFSNRLINSLDKLPSVQYTTLYRGMNNISIKDAFGTTSKNSSFTKDQDKYLILDSFTSTTKNKQVALGFLSGQNAALMTIKSHSGKAVDKYSHFPSEGQVLLPPYLYFKITRFEQNLGGIQEIDLQQIPFPKTNKKKLIFWVDDIPAGNRSIIENQFEPQGIEVVQVMSTSIMKIILRDFLGILQAIGKQIVIISDMGRYQDGAWNCEAGVDLFNLIYKQYGMSNKAIIFTMDQKKARNAIRQRGINQSNWTVLVDSDKVVAQVMAEFNK